MTDNRRFRTAAGENEIRHSYEALIAKHIPDVVRRTVRTSIGPVATLTTGPEGGTPVVLLHGSGATALSWAPALLRLSDEYRLHAIDLPGEAGASTPTRVPFVAEEQARWLAEVHRELVDRPAVFVGVSVGGWIATALAVHEPQRVSRLVLQSASGFGPRKTVPLVLAGVLAMLGDRGRRQALAYLTGPRADAGLRSMMQRDIDAFARARRRRPGADSRTDNCRLWCRGQNAGRERRGSKVADGIPDSDGRSSRAGRAPDWRPGNPHPPTAQRDHPVAAEGKLSYRARLCGLAAVPDATAVEEIVPDVEAWSTELLQARNRLATQATTSSNLNGGRARSR